MNLKHHIGIGQMKISQDRKDILVAANLGSCLGISVYDPMQKVGGMIHCLLPISKSDPAKAKKFPGMYVDTGVAKLFKEILQLGCSKKKLIVAVAGGSNINDANNHFQVGRRNYTVLRKFLWQNNILIRAENVGQDAPCTLALKIDSGEVWLKSNAEMVQMI